MKKKRKRTITVTVEGGLIQHIAGIPKNVRVRVMDFDTDGGFNGADEEKLPRNKDGDEYIESIWE